MKALLTLAASSNFSDVSSASRRIGGSLDLPTSRRNQPDFDGGRSDWIRQRPNRLLEATAVAFGILPFAFGLIRALTTGQDVRSSVGRSRRIGGSGGGGGPGQIARRQDGFADRSRRHGIRDCEPLRGGGGDDPRNAFRSGPVGRSHLVRVLLRLSRLCSTSTAGPEPRDTLAEPRAWHAPGFCPCVQLLVVRSYAGEADTFPLSCPGPPISPTTPGQLSRGPRSILVTQSVADAELVPPGTITGFDGYRGYGCCLRRCRRCSAGPVS